MTVKYRLKAGDILLYRPKGLFGQIIGIKTWHEIAHVEIYDGLHQSLASRDGLGVDRYSVRLSELAYVLRPKHPLDIGAGRRYFYKMKGTSYGWLDLLNFVGLPINAPGIVCSPFAAGFLRACGWPVFPADPIERVAPFQFLDLIGDECQIAYGPLK